MSKINLVKIHPRKNRVRTVSFRNRTDPYVLFHREPGELADDRLEANYAEWLATTKEPSDAEEFEEFLTWLETEKGYSSLLVQDSMYFFE